MPLLTQMMIPKVTKTMKYNVDDELKKIQEKINKLPKHDFGIYENSVTDNDKLPIDGRIIVTEKNSLLENAGFEISVKLADDFKESGKYDITIKQSYYPKERAELIKEKEDELVKMIGDIVGLNLTRCLYNAINELPDTEQSQT